MTLLIIHNIFAAFVLLSDLFLYGTAYLIFPSQGRARGGYIVSINTSTFSKQLEAKINISCIFSCGNSSIQGAASVFDPRDSDLLCNVPFWEYGSCLARIIVVENSEEVLNSSIHLSFLFLTEWTQVSPLGAPTIGGTNLRIYGVGFNQNTTYTCRFSITLTLISLEVTAHYLDAGQLVCISPSFNIISRSRSAEFSLKAEGNLVPGPLETTVVYFSAAMWFSAQPLSYSSAGGRNITIQGERFNAMTTPYRLKFHSITNEIDDLFSECQITNSQRLLCKSPILHWDSGPVHDISLEMSLLDSFSVVGQTGEPANFVLYGVGEWNYFEVQYLQPWSGYRSVCLGNQLIVYGRFRNDSNIQCKFNSSSGMTYAKALVTQFQVTCPLASVSDGTLLFSLVDGFGVKIPFYSEESIDNRINVTAACWNADVIPSQGPSAGSTLLRLTGSGFCSLGPSCANAFVCQFQAEANASMVAYSPVTIRSSGFLARRFLTKLWRSQKRAYSETTYSQIVNNSMIFCATPVWPYPAATARVLLIDVSTGLQNGRPVGFKNGVISYDSPVFPRFVFQSTISVVSPENIPAAGLQLLTVSGTGFNQKNTTCSYQFDGIRIFLPAINVSFSEIRCPAPPWPAVAGDISKTSAVLTVLQGLADSLAYQSNSYTLKYLPYVFGVSSCTSTPPCNTTSGYAGVEFNVQLLVRGFDPGLISSYFLQFTSPSGQVLRSNLFGVSNLQAKSDFLVLQANLSKWSFESAKTRVTVVVGTYTLTPTVSSFEFRQLGLGLIDNILPAIDRVNCPFGICWPLVITISGSGFVKNLRSKTVQLGSRLIINETDYNCNIRGDDNFTEVVIAIVTVDSPSQIRCIGDFSRPLDYYSQRYSVNLQYKDKSIGWLKHFPTFNLVPVFTGLECGALCFGKTVGSDILNIFGYGFNSDLDLSCTFASEASDLHSALSQASLISTSQIRCASPRWLYGEGRVMVQIVMKDSFRVREFLSTPQIFRFDAVWWLENMATVVKNESSIALLIQGLGFIPGDYYFLSTTCTDFLGRKFVVNSSQLISAVSYNNLTLFTPFPEDLGSEGNVSVQIFRCSRAGDCQTIAPYIRSMHFAEFKLQGSISDVSVSVLGALDLPFSCWTESICWAPAGGSGSLELSARGLHFRGVSYYCKFTDQTQFEVSLGSVSDSGNLICATPLWPSCPARVTLSILSEISGSLSIPSSFQMRISPVVQSLYPSHGPISGSIVTISGIGFVGQTLSCRFSAWFAIDTGGFSKMFLQALVPGSVVSNTELICDTSGAWRGYPALKTSLVVVFEDSDIYLKGDIAINATEISASCSSDVSFDRLLIGTYLLIENETLLLTDSTCVGILNTNCVLNVQRGMLGTLPAFHSTTSVIRPLIPFISGMDDLEYMFDAVVLSLNASGARVDGGMLLSVTVLGLKSTYKSVLKKVQNSSCNPSSQTSISPQIIGAAGPLFWGIAFDVSAKYDLQIQSLDFNPLVLGIQKVWILHRRRATCGSSKICSNWGHGLVFSDWELLGSSTGFQINVISTDPIPLTINFTLNIGERHGFLIIAQNGLQVGMSDGNSSINSGFNNNQGFLNDCNLFHQDSSLEIHSGQLILSSMSRKNMAPLSLVKVFGNQSNPYLYQGTLKYLRMTIGGPLYKCKFISLARSGLSVESAQTQAISNEIDPVPIQATGVVCIVPPWPYGESVTSLIISGSDGKDIDTDSSGNLVLFRMSAAVSEFFGPALGNASGGDKFIFIGLGLGSPGFLCQFSSLEHGDQSQSVMVVSLNDTYAECITPNWRFAASKVLVEIGSVRPEISPLFTAVPNVNSSALRKLFLFVEVWETIFPTEGFGGVNDLITVRGAGFDNSSQYKFVFGDIWGHSASTYSQPLNSSLVVFRSPQWGSTFASAVTTVRMLKIANPGRNLTEIKGGNKTFTFQAVWTVDKFYLNQTLGSLIVKVHGGGFDTSSSYYLKIISDSLGTVLFSTSVTATSSTSMEIMLQDWELDGLLKMTLLDGKRQPICSSVTSQTLCSSFDFRVALNETCLSIQPSLAPASGGQILTVKGAGFMDQSPDKDKEYTCIFVSTENNASDITVNSTFIDISHLICITPRFMVAGAYLMLVAHGSRIVPFNTLSGGFPFYVSEVWSWPGFARSGPASGGSVLTLKVFGLKQNISHFCMFTRGSAKICSNARVLENSSVSCSSVAWGILNSASTVGLYLLDDSCDIGYMDGRSPKFLETFSDKPNDPSKRCNHPACWTFEPTWLTASTSGRAYGGDNITVAGFGFELSITYFLKFVGKYRNASTKLASPISPNSLTFATPEWKGPEESTMIFLEDSQGRTVQKAGGVSYFSFLSCWISKDTSATSALALDSKSIVFHGAGFDRMSDRYQCVFSRGSNSISTDAAPLDYSILICPPPPKWKYGPGIANLMVVKNQSNYVQTCRSDTNQSFIFFGGWFALSLSAGPALGGLILTVTGFGFDIYANKSSCVYGNNGTEMDSMASVISDSQIVCQTPSWGNYYAHATVSISLKLDGAVIDFVNRSLMVPIFVFYPIWTSAVTENYISAQDSVLGGGVLMIYGAGFDLKASYRCIFGVESSISQSTPASNTTVIRFSIPRWTGVAQTVKLTLLSDDSKLIVQHINLDKAVNGDLFTFVPSWDNISSGLLIGQNKLILSGCFVWAYGAGFNVETNYTCLFWTDERKFNGIRFAGFKYAAPAFALSENVVRCLSPSYVNSSDWMHFSIFDADSKELRTSNNNTFEIWCSWLKVIPSYGTVLGGSLLTILGDGFNKNSEYICRFQSEYTANTSFASVIDFNQITCEIPALRFEVNQPHMNVQLALLRQGVNCAYVDPNHNSALNFTGFEYVPSIQRSEPSRSVALGGVMLQIFGSGFTFSVDDTCTFTSPKCSLNVSTPTQLVSDQTLQCIAPLWPCQAGLVNLSFARSHAMLQFEYIPAINMIDKTKVLAKGNQQISAFGAGFSQGAYLIVFSAATDQSSNSSCSCEISSLIVCNLSAWAYEAQNVSVSFQTSDGLEIFLNKALRLEFQAGWDSIDLSQNSGPSSGNRTFGVMAYGLNCTSNYVCTFGSPGMLVKGICSCKSSFLLICNTPQRGNQYEAGPVPISITTSEGRILPFTNFGTFPIDSSICISDCYRAIYHFLTEWMAFRSQPSQIAAWGQESITIIGSGFSRVSKYSLNISSLDYNGNEFSRLYDFINTTTLVFFSPKYEMAWNHASVKLLENGKTVPFQTGNYTVSIIPGIITLNPSRGPAAGGVRLSIIGFGLLGQELRCYLNGTLPSEAVVLSSELAYCTLPTFLDAAESVDFGLYSTTLDQYISPFQAILGDPSKVNLLGEQIKFSFYAELQSIHPVISDRLGASEGKGSEITVLGYGFDSSKNYLCRFTSEGVHVPSRIYQSLGKCLNSSILVCHPPTWDLMTPWKEYNESNNLANFGLLVDERAVPLLGWIDPTTAQFMFSDILVVSQISKIQVTFVQVNTAPFFLIRSNMSRLVSYVTKDRVVVSGLIIGVTPGDSEIEKSQKLTFMIQAAQAFTEYPWISQNGSLIYSFSSGVLTLNNMIKSSMDVQLKVILLDDGGLDYGGSNKFSKTIILTLVNPALGSILASSYLPLAECESCDSVIIRPFLCDTTRGLPCTDLNAKILLNFSKEYFSVSPFYSSALNELNFKLKSFVFGKINISIYLESDSIQNATFVLDVSSVNQRSSFVIRYPIILAKEVSPGYFQIFGDGGGIRPDLSAECTLNLCTVKQFADSIMQGPNLTISTGPEGEDLAEISQHVTFLIFPRNFSSTQVPFLTSDGTLIFNVAYLHQEFNSFTVLLYDDGGTDNGGLDESLSHQFSIIINTYFKAPQFSFSCDPDDDRIQCSPSCYLQPQNCSLSISIEKSCKDCSLEQQCNDGKDCNNVCFLFASFAKEIQPASSGSIKPKGSGQNMTFIVTAKEEMTIIFGNNQVPAINAHSGDLTFCLNSDHCYTDQTWTSYEVVLVDSIGNFPGENASMQLPFTLLIQQINQKPSFDLRSTRIFLWENIDYISFPLFAVNITKGNLNSSFFDCESTQNLTFHVIYDPSFFDQITLEAHDGNLSFSLKSDAYGSTDVQIYLQDDGGTKFNGEPVSEIRVLQIHVVGYYARVNMPIPLGLPDALIVNQSPLSDLHLGQGQIFVLFQESEAYSRCDVHDEMLIWSSPSASGGDMPCFCLPECKCAYSSNNSSAHSRNFSKICIVSDDLDSLMSITKGFNSTVSVVRRNFQKIPFFDVRNSSLQYIGSNVNDGIMVLESNFIQSIIEPENVEINLDGSSNITFKVQAIGRRAYPALYPWIFDFQDGGLLDRTPSVEILCFPRKKANSGIQCSSFLKLQFRPSFNGEVVYSVRFAGSSFERNITVGVRLAFSFKKLNILVSPEKSDSFILDFLQANFAAPLYSTFPFDFAIEIREETVARDARIEKIGTSFSNYSLHLNLFLGKAGVQKFWLYAGDIEFVTAGDTFELSVLSRNYAPAFEILCSSPNLKCVGNCSSHRSDLTPNCTVVIQTDQNCGQCTTGQGCCLQFRTIASWIQSSGPSFWNESDQKVTFTVAPILEDDSGRNLPYLDIDAKSGNLTLCPSPLSYGRRAFRVDLWDDGNVSNGGSNLAIPAYLDVYVSPINQQPSFEINSKFRSNLLWTSQNQVWTFQNFAINISKGNVDMTGLDVEYSQNTTFKVFLVNGSDLYECSKNASHCPGILNIDIDSKGTLQFLLKASWSGTMVLQAYLEDNGGVYSCGENISIPRAFELYVVKTYIRFSYLIQSETVQVFNETLVTWVREKTALFLNTYQGMVFFIPNSTESIGASDIIAPPYGRQLLSSDQHWRVSSLSTLYVFGFSQNEVKRYYTFAQNISRIILSGSSSLIDTTFISATTYMANFQPYFDLAALQLESGCSKSFMYENFLQNVTGPRDNPLDSNGSESIVFLLRAVRFRPSDESNWTNNSNGGMFIVDPAIELNCNPDCTSGNLRFISKNAYNGQVEYSVSMMDVNGNVVVLSRLFTIVVGPCFLFPPQLMFYEGDGYTNISCFAECNFGGVDQSPPLPLPFLPSIQGNFSTVFIVPPILEINGSCVNLAFQIKPFWIGNVTLNISAMGINIPFLMIFLPVNYPPLFTLSSDIVVIPKNKCDTHPCTRHDLILSVFAGPQSAFGENRQLLTFQVFALNASETANLFLISPNITLMRDNLTLTWDASVMFQTVPNRFSGNISYFNLSLVDNGTPRKSSSKVLGIWIQDVNRAPSFKLYSDIITLFENSSAYTQSQFAQNISAGDDEESKVQSLTFIIQVDKTDMFLYIPHLHINGTLEFQVRPGFFGTLNMTISLFDDGNTLWNGTNRSYPRTVQIDIVHINYSPRFCFIPGNQSIVIYGSNVLRNETILFATNLVSGHAIEYDQKMSFLIAGVNFTHRNDLLTNSGTAYANPLEQIYAFIDDNLFSDSEAIQKRDLLCNENLTLPLKYGYLNFTLKPSTFGDVFIKLILFDNGGTLGSGKNASDAEVLKISVLPANYPPSFIIVQSKIVVTEGIKDQIFDNIFYNISEGGSSSRNADAQFIFRNYSLFADISGSCYMGANARCSNSSGFLKISTNPFVFGNFSFQVALKTLLPCCDRRGSDTSPWLTIDVEILAINNPPSFKLSSESLFVLEGYDLSVSCITSGSTSSDSVWGEFRAQPGYDFECGSGLRSGFLDYSIGNFANDISLGYHEWNTGDCTPGFHCESQAGQFFIEDSNFNTSSQIFLRPPRIDFPSGRLNFTLKPYFCGTATFYVKLTDYGALDGTSKTSTQYNLSIEVLPVDHPPDFYVYPLDIYDNKKFIEYNLVSNITANGFGAQKSYCPSRTQGNLTFLLQFEGSILFNGQPTFTVSGTDGVLFFKLKDHITGQMNGTIVAQKSGGLSTSKKFKITVWAQSPSFELNSTLSIIQVSQDSGPHRFEQFVYALSLESEVGAGFVILNQSNPTLLHSGPFIGLDGVLTFMPRGDISGSTTITFALQGTMVSSWLLSIPTTFHILVKSVESVPELWLSSNQLSFYSNADKARIDGFVSAFTTQARYLPSVEVVFNLDSSARIEFKKVRTNKLGRALMLAVDYVESPDGYHMYVAEYTTDTISIWILDLENSSFPVQFLDRVQYPELRGPISIDASEDGTAVYVSCKLSAAILTLRRDHRNFSCTYGLLTLYRNYSYFGSDMTWGLWSGTWNGTDARQKFPLAGLSSLKLSKDLLNLYATTLSGAVAIFQRNISTGALQPLDIFSFSSSQLSGASGLCISGDGSFMFIASWSDQTVFAFQRDLENGMLIFSDRISNGERLLWQYQVYLDSSISLENSKQTKGEWSSGSMYPLRLGGGYLWSNYARASKSFEIDGEFFLVIAASDPDPALPDGTAVLYVWIPATEEFNLVQTFELDRRASSTEFFTVNAEGTFQNFLVISNSLFADGQALNIYLWNSSSRIFNIYDQPRFGKLLRNINNIHYFGIDGKQFLAITRYPLDDILDDSYSVILVWNDQSVRSSTKISKMVGFEMFQVLSGPASCVESATFANSNLLFFTTSKLRSEHIAGTWIGSTLDVYSFEQGRFRLIQSRPALGAYGIEVFSFSEGDFLALACRQFRRQLSRNDYAAFDGASYVFKWDSTAHQLVLFQVLDGDSFQTLPEEGAALQKVYEFAYPSNVSSIDEYSQPVKSFRGVTSFKSFFSDGEQYLAVAQSVCESFAASSSCDMLQPRSAILQFSRAKKRFTEMSTWTKELRAQFYDGDVDQQSPAGHEFPIRVNAGKAVDWEFFEIRDKRFLLALSLTKGAVVYQWRFEHVFGLKGASHIVSNRNGSQVYVVGVLDSAVVQISYSKRERLLLFESQKCLWCFQFTTVYTNRIADSEIDLHSFKSFRFLNLSTDVGFEGVIKVGLSSTDRSLVLTEPELFIAIDLPINSRLCAFPEIFQIPFSSICPDQSSPPKQINISYTCILTSFVISPATMHSGPDLSVFMHLSPDGSFYIDITPFQPGNTEFEVKLQATTLFLHVDGNTGRYYERKLISNTTSASRNFTLDIVSVNSKPSFVPYDIFATLRPQLCNLTDSLSQSCLVSNEHLRSYSVFARNVSAGTREEYQNMSWKFSYSNQEMFVEKPSLFLIKRNNFLYGAISFRVHFLAKGQSCFNVTLQDDGPSNYSFGDENESDPKVFCLNLRSLGRELDISNHSISLFVSEKKYIQNFVIDMQKVGCDRHTADNLAFIVRVQALDSLNQENVFSYFNIDMCGNLKFSLWPWIDGSYLVELTRKTNLHFMATSRFLLNVTRPYPQHLLCDFGYLTSILLYESNTSTEYVIPNAFNISSLSPILDPSSLLSLYSISGDDLFHMTPLLYPNFSLVLRIKPFVTGASIFRFELSSSVCGSQSFFSASVNIKESFVPTQFAIMRRVEVVASSTLQTVPNFLNYTRSESPCMGVNCLQFVVSWVSNDLWFDVPPEIDSYGVLTFKISENAFGLASLYVKTNRYSNFENTSILASRMCTLFVHPKLKILNIVPTFGPITGGTFVTLTGIFWIPTVLVDKKNIAVFFGQSECLNVTTNNLYSSLPPENSTTQQILCTTAEGIGLATVEIHVLSNSIVRKVQIENAYTFVAFLYGGALSSTGGFLALGPQGYDPVIPSNPGSSMQTASLSISGTVLAIVTFGSRIIVAGNFLYVQNTKVDHIFSWNGTEVILLGRGLDGAVKSMTNYMGGLVCGGSFTRGFSTSGKSVTSGGLISWNGIQWTTVGRAFVGSRIHAVQSNGTLLFIAGRHTKSEHSTLGALSVFDGSTWTAVGGGVFGGDIYALTIYDDSVYVGGSFSQVGNLQISNFARWDGSKWLPLATFDGSVYSIVVVGQQLFIGGDFRNGCSLGLSYLVKLDSGICTSVADNTLNGAVVAMHFNTGCLYFGGLFKSIGNPCQPTHLGRFCLSSDNTLEESECGLQQVQGAQYLGPVYHITSWSSEKQ